MVYPANQFQNQTYINNQFPAQGADHWEIDVDCVEHCGKAPEHVIVWVKPLAKVKIDALMEKFPNIEWLAYLLSDDPEKEPHIVSDIFIPDQEVTATSVDNIQCETFNDLPTIGVIHSHHGMGTGFSGTDHAWINQNHNISLVIAKTGVDGQVRWKTPCDSMKIVPAKVKPYISCEWDKEEFIKEEVKKIASKKYGYQARKKVKGNNLNANQKTFVQGQSIKEIVEEGTEGTEETATNTASENENPDEWNSGLTQSNSDDAPAGEEQSLLEALEESFPDEVA
jgi:hypothetical protein